MSRTNPKTSFAILIAACLVSSPLSAQSFVDASAADLYDLQIGLSNPAVIRFQDAQLNVGTRIMHYGLLADQAAAIRNDFFSLTFPQVRHVKIGVGLAASSFRTPLFREQKLAFLTSVKVRENIGIGTQFGLLSKSFNRDRFMLDDANDPVFQKGTAKYALDVGVGIFARATENLQIGASIENLNAPDISLAADVVRQTRILNFTADYRFYGWEGSAGVLFEGARFYPNVSVSSNVQGIGALQLGLRFGELDVSSQLHVSEKLSVDYRYSYPLSPINAFSNGSHRIGFTFRFGDIPPVKFQVFAAVDTQKITVRRIYKRMHDGISENRIPPIDIFARLKSAKGSYDTYYQFVPGDSVDPLPQIDFRKYLEKYQSIINTIARRLRENHALTLRIIVSKSPVKIRLAKSIRDYMATRYGIAAGQLRYGHAIFQKEDFVSTNGKVFDRTERIGSKITYFFIKPLIPRKYHRISGIKAWTLIIVDSRGEIIRSFQGQKEPPASVAWDWTGQNGQLVDIGKYVYYLEWADKNNKVWQSPKRFIFVSKFVRETTVDYRRQFQNSEMKHQRIDWHLGKPKNEKL